MTEGKVTFRIRGIQGDRSEFQRYRIFWKVCQQKRILDYLTNAGSSAVIDLAEFKEKEINRDSVE